MLKLRLVLIVLFAVSAPAASADTGRPLARRRAVELVDSRYQDFGPTLAAEKVALRHGLKVSVETLRRWMGIVLRPFWMRQRRSGQKPLHASHDAYALPDAWNTLW